MGWKHYQAWDEGKTCVIQGDDAVDCKYEIGAICTGKQRVFHRYYIRIHLPDGFSVIGEHEYNVRAALFALNRELKIHDMCLLAAGLDEQWAETGLSHNSGFGYFPDSNSVVNMMSLPPLRERDPENDEFVGRLIEEALASMTFGKTAIDRC